MRITTLGIGLAALVAASGCGRADGAATSAEPDDALRRDLAQASQTSLTLPGTTGAKPMQVVSAIELSPKVAAAPVRTGTKKRATRARATRRVAAVAATPAPKPERAPEPAPVASEVATEVAVVEVPADPTPAEAAPVSGPAADAGTEPVIDNPRPAPAGDPAPVGGGGGWDGGWGGGGGIGGVIGGVIIRGGGMDGDHCIPRGRRGRGRDRGPGIAIMIPRGAERGPMGGPIFPRY